MINYLHGSPNEFYNFVDGISKDDKIGVITHIDLDGVASAVFLEKILESKQLKINSLEFLDYGKGVLSKTFKKMAPTKLFITDFQADSCPEEFSFLRNNCDVYLIDHHPINEKVRNESRTLKTESGDCSAYCLFDLAKHYIDTKPLEWLVCSAMVSDSSFKKDENLNFIQSVYPGTTGEDIFNSEPGKISEKISGALIYYNSNLKKVYNSILRGDLKKLEKADKIIGGEINTWIGKFKQEAQYYPEKNLYFYHGTPKYPITRIVSSIVSDKEFPNSSIVFVSDHSTKKGHVKISTRNQSGEINLGDVLRKCIKGFYDATAGGHPKASGADFPKQYLPEFKSRLFHEL